MDHPLVSDLDRLLKGQLSPAETRTIVLHFLDGCPDCAEHFSADMLPDAPFPPPEDYDTLFDRLERSESGPWSDVPPALLWAELEPLTPARRVLALQNRRYRSPVFASWLTRHSRALAEDASPSAPLAAHVAVDVLAQLTHHSEISEGLGRELRVSALANLGNASRALGAFAGALEAFDQAEESSAPAAPSTSPALSSSLCAPDSTGTLDGSMKRRLIYEGPTSSARTEPISTQTA